MGLACSGRPQEHDVFSSGDEVERSQVGDHVSFQRPLVVEIELFNGFAGGEAGGADTQLPTVGLSCCHLPFQAGGQELLVGPLLGLGPFRQPLIVLGQRGRFQSSTQIRHI